MKRCLPLTLACLAVGTATSHGLSIPTPVVYPDFFAPADDLTVTAPSVPAGEALGLHVGGTASGSLGTHWMATASGAAVLGSNLLTEVRLSETAAQIVLTGSAMEFGLTNDPDAILGALSVGAGLSLSWSATATLDAPGNEFVLAPNTTYRIRFHVDAGSGLLNSALSLSPSFGVELLDGAGCAVGYSGGGTIANLVGLQLESTAGAPAGTGDASVEFRTGATVPAGAAGIRFTGSATLPASAATIGTTLATVSDLSIGEVTPYMAWIEDSGLSGGQLDPGADPGRYARGTGPAGSASPGHAGWARDPGPWAHDSGAATQADRGRFRGRTR